MSQNRNQSNSSSSGYVQPDPRQVQRTQDQEALRAGGGRPRR